MPFPAAAAASGASGDVAATTGATEGGVVIFHRHRVFRSRRSEFAPLRSLSKSAVDEALLM